ncbi:MAG: thiamine-monophosphate kinase [Planctomycetes bacterium]|nr:thiamine-monophosphate kinase [Planctomycetota bacterium]
MSLCEDNLVAWFQTQCHGSAHKVPIPVGDDMAEVQVGHDATALITTDMLLEGVHFDLSTTDLAQVGYKAMAVSLSDCAAMATNPVAAVVSVGLPKSISEADLKTLHQGMVRAGDAFDCPLVGGDTTCWRADAPLVINVAMLSRPASHCAPVKRSTARIGDVICVTGTLGGSLSGHHLTFTPRVQEALALTNLVPIHAMMDLSDGLSTDLTRLCRASAVGARIQAEKLPMTEAAKTTQDPEDAALNDGEDFELLFTLSLDHHARLLETWSLPTRITAIGHISKSLDLLISRENQPTETLRPAGFDHFFEKSKE